jgi:hypothetical protein
MTRAYLGLAAFDALLLTVGYAWLYGLRLLTARTAIICAPLALLVGVMATGTGLAWAVCAGVDPRVSHVVAVAALAAAVGVAARRRLDGGSPYRAGRPRPALVVVAAVATAILVATALTQLVWAAKANADVTWDVWWIWESKGRALYYLHDWAARGGPISFGHADYPPLVPTMIASQYHFMGGAYARVLPLQQAIVSAAFLGSLVALLRPRVPAWLLMASVAALAAAPQFWGRMDSVMPDLTIGYFVAIAAVAWILWLDERRTTYMALATLALAAAALTKNEGLMLGLALLVGVAVAVAARDGLRSVRSLAPALLAPAAILPWKLWLRLHELPKVETDYAWADLFRPAYLADRTDRLAYAVPHMLSTAFDTNGWLLILPAALTAIAVAASAARPAAIAVATWMLLSFCGLAAVYWIGRLEIGFYIETSAVRVVAILPLVGGSVTPLLLALAFGPRPGVRRLRPPSAPAATRGPR